MTNDIRWKSMASKRDAIHLDRLSQMPLHALLPVNVTMPRRNGRCCGLDARSGAAKSLVGQGRLRSGFGVVLLTCNHIEGMTHGSEQSLEGGHVLVLDCSG